jgi:hypothetical protein
MTTIQRCNMPKSTALSIGLLATAAVAGLQLFNGFACYKLSLGYHLAALALVALAFLPGIVCLASKNPLRTAGAALLFAPWLVTAFYIDCVVPPKGPASSMSYLMVVVYGFLSSTLGALITAPVLRLLRVGVTDA